MQSIRAECFSGPGWSSDVTGRSRHLRLRKVPQIPGVFALAGHMPTLRLRARREAAVANTGYLAGLVSRQGAGRWGQKQEKRQDGPSAFEGKGTGLADQGVNALAVVAPDGTSRDSFPLISVCSEFGLPAGCV